MKQHLTGQENLVGLFLGVEDIEAKVGGKEAGTAKGEECEGFFQTGMGTQGPPHAQTWYRCNAAAPQSSHKAGK